MNFLTLFGTLQHWFCANFAPKKIWMLALLLVLFVLAILHHIWRDDDYKLDKWRVMAMLPLAMGAAHMLIVLRPHWEHFGAFLEIYMIAFLSIIPMLLAKRRIGYRIFTFISGTLSLLFGLIFIFRPSVSFYTNKSYTKSFHAAVKELDRRYVLKEWKGIDLAAMEAKYMPRIEEAEREQDIVKFEDAIEDFAMEMHDGHFWVFCSHDVDLSQSQYQQHEYGLGLIPLDSGEVIAVCTAEEVQKLGIEDGTVITKWNGKPVAKAAAEDVRDEGWPVKANADIERVIYLAQVGGETVDVTFLDKSGKEKTVTLNDLGEPHSLDETYDTFMHETHTYEGDENHTAKMLDDKCGYLLVNTMRTENPIQDLLGYFSGDHKWAREMYREKLRDLKSQGMEYLIIDLRCNGGGYHEVGMALTSLLTNEDQYGQGLGIYKKGKYTCAADRIIHADGEFADLPVVVLTNSGCTSAGDGAALYLSRLPNVTLAGITDPSGCGQETGGIINLTDDMIEIDFPSALCLNENGEPNIDTAADGISRNPVEERIPFDMDAAMKMFRDREDYELNWAMDYLKAHS